MGENTLDIGVKQGKNNLYTDFKKRYEQYSKLGWKNKKGMDKTSVSGQVPAFSIRLVSDSALTKLKNNFPEIYEEIKKMNIIFQYIKYRPKKAASEWARNILANAKYKFNGRKWEQQAKGYRVTAKSPTRESLGLTRMIEEFKLKYPKILYRKSDGTIDYIKSDWTGYLVTMVRYPLNDGQIVGPDYFFKFPATIKDTQKAEVDEKVFKKVNKVLNEIEEIISQFEYGDQEMYKIYKPIIIKLANSLTLEGLNEALAEKISKEQEEELRKKMLITEIEDINGNGTLRETTIDWDSLSQTETEIITKKNIGQEVDWESFGISNIEEPNIETERSLQEKKLKESEIDWDSF